MKFNFIKFSASFLAVSLGWTLTSCKDSQSKPVIKATESSERKTTLLTSSHENWKYGKLSYQHADKIVSFGPRPPQSKALEQTRQYLQAELEKLGWLVRRQSFVARSPKGNYQFVNLYARYGGKEGDPDKVWAKEHRGVVAAHMDSKLMKSAKFVGAVDAAAPVGMVVEMAAFLTKNSPEKAKDLELVFFDGEEGILENMVYNDQYRDGLYGSHYYALHRNRKREFGVLLDLLGIKDQKILVPSDSPPVLYKDLMEIAKAHGVEQYFGKLKSPILDDHVPLNIFGTPTIDLIGEFNPGKDGWWHQKEDTMAIVSAEQLGMNLKVVIDLVVTQLDK